MKIAKSVILGSLLVGAIVGCGSDDDEDSSPATTGTVFGNHTPWSAERQRSVQTLFLVRGRLVLQMLL